MWLWIYGCGIIGKLLSLITRVMLHFILHEQTFSTNFLANNHSYILRPVTEHYPMCDQLSLRSSLAQDTDRSRHSPIVGSMLGQRLRRWLNIETATGEYLVSAGAFVRDLPLNGCGVRLTRAADNSVQTGNWSPLAEDRQRRTLLTRVSFIQISREIASWKSPGLADKRRFSWGPTAYRSILVHARRPRRWVNSLIATALVCLTWLPFPWMVSLPCVCVRVL